MLQTLTPHSLLSYLKDTYQAHFLFSFKIKRGRICWRGPSAVQQRRLEAQCLDGGENLPKFNAFASNRLALFCLSESCHSIYQKLPLLWERGIFLMSRNQTPKFRKLYYLLSLCFLFVRFKGIVDKLLSIHQPTSVITHLCIVRTQRLWFALSLGGGNAWKTS